SSFLLSLLIFFGIETKIFSNGVIMCIIKMNHINIDSIFGAGCNSRPTVMDHGCSTSVNYKVKKIYELSSVNPEPTVTVWMGEDVELKIGVQGTCLPMYTYTLRPRLGFRVFCKLIIDVLNDGRFI